MGARSQRRIPPPDPIATTMERTCLTSRRRVRTIVTWRRSTTAPPSASSCCATPAAWTPGTPASWRRASPATPPIAGRWLPGRSPTRWARSAMPCAGTRRRGTRSPPTTSRSTATAPGATPTARRSTGCPTAARARWACATTTSWCADRADGASRDARSSGCGPAAPGSTMSERKVAFITGASRGIGRGCALELARRGFDLVLTARTVTGAERFEHSSTIVRSATDPLPGTLHETAREAGALGAATLVVALDLLEPADPPAAVEAAVARFGRIDVLINNGRYVGPGHMDVFEETPVELIEQMLLCNVVAPLHLIKLCLPAMKRQGGGIVINITSSAGERETPAPIGQGGWGLGYSLSKAAFNRMVPGLAKELRTHRIAVIGLMPGFVGTERMAQELGEFGFDASKALPVENPGRVCAMLATAADPMYFSGKDVYGPAFHAEHALVRFDPAEEPR